MKLEEPVEDDSFIELSGEVGKLDEEAELSIIGYPEKYTIL